MGMFIRIEPNSNGSHDDARYQSTPPELDDKWAIIPTDLESTAISLLPWVNLTITDGVLISVEDNAEARAAWETTAAQEASAKAKADQIAALKSQLETTDYKIIKCSEYQLTGQPLPYDVTILHTDRQALRDQINALEVPNAP
jgi:hypothetical protein